MYYKNSEKLDSLQRRESVLLPDRKGYVVEDETSAGQARGDKEFRKPQKKKNIWSFLGLVGYYRNFIPNFSTLAASLSDLTGKKIPDKPNWTFVQVSFENSRRP